MFNSQVLIQRVILTLSTLFLLVSTTYAEPLRVLPPDAVPLPPAFERVPERNPQPKEIVWDNTTFLCEVGQYYSLKENGVESPPDPSYWIGKKFTVNRFTGEWDGFMNLGHPQWTPVIWSTGTSDGDFFVRITWYGQKNARITSPIEFSRASVNLTIQPPAEWNNEKATQFLIEDSGSLMTGNCEPL